MEFRKYKAGAASIAIDDDALKEDFRQWAALGGGDYFNADSAEALSESLTQSLRPRFVVEDDTGATVRAGRVGESDVELPAGRYRIRFGDKQITDEVVIRGVQPTEVLLSE